MHVLDLVLLKSNVGYTKVHMVAAQIFACKKIPTYMLNSA